MNPELIIKGNEIDYALATALGEKPSDFLVTCFDGVVFELFGSPYDTPANREEIQLRVEMLNNDSAESWWPEFFESWKPEICKQFSLPPTTTHFEFRPVVSWQIHRVVAGRSEFLHCAIRLFEELEDRIQSWAVRQTDIDQNFVEIVPVNSFHHFVETAETMPMAISKAVLRMLKQS